MTLKTLEHTLGVVRRQVLEEFPELTLHFILLDNTSDQIKIHKVTDISDHPAKDNVYEMLEKNQPSKTDIIGINFITPKTLPFLKKKTQYVVTCCINLKDLKAEKELIFPDKDEEYERITGYRLAWKAIKLYEDFKREKPKQFVKDSQHPYYIPKENKIEQLRSNLLSECFAAMLMEQRGDNGTILQLMKKRCELCITKTKDYAPENYPFPITYDATRIVFNELRNTNPDNINELIKHTLSISDEISSTFDEITLRQWIEFCYCAQEMAWNGRNRHEILSAASYNSEDAHTRTTAYIIAEALNTDVTPLNKPTFHNPFADQAKFERQHHKEALETFESVITEALQNDKPELILQKILQQNNTIYNGQIIGWCAPALARTYQAINNSNISETDIRSIFEKALKETKWHDICKLSRFIMTKKRNDTSITSDVVIRGFIKNNEELEIFKEAFSTI
ncbi:MAG: hypothetical protein CBB87_10860 [Micavibrio sp. TMED27]|nr:hypothetical protein [Micavibrio sp.]OUT90021.1 MAG: hypothetical protein CBB87_10860 [Micavibrio sp. TMED27]|tara:strand:- start:4783 stop:6138 length:1356 start_codon:yes stop_codon:yes gene_type:complete